MIDKNRKAKNIIRKLVAKYISKESNRQSLITVTGIELKRHGTLALISITVLPEEKEISAIDFVRRQLPNLRQYVSDNSRLSQLPFFEVAIDIGEKNRQRIDEINNKL